MEEQLIVGYNDEGLMIFAGGQFRAGDVKEYFEKIKKGEFQ